MRSLFMNIDDAIQAFKSCRGPVIAVDAEGGNPATVTGLEGRRLPDARLVVRFAGRTESVFTAQNDSGDGPIGTYLRIAVFAPKVPDCEPVKIEIHDGGIRDYARHEGGSGSYEPVLTLTLVNKGAEERNAPIIAAWEAEQRRQQEAQRRRDDDAAARAKAELAARLKTRREEVAALLEGKRTEGVSIEGNAPDHLTSLTLTLADGTSVKIRARLDHSLEITQITR